MTFGSGYTSILGDRLSLEGLAAPLTVRVADRKVKRPGVTTDTVNRI